jgi:hypothetical protein
MLKILSISATLSFLLVSSAMAQSGVGACAADIKKVCANIEPGNLRIAACLKDRLTDLSDVCKARLAEVAAAGKTCRADVESKAVSNVGASRKWLASGMPSPLSATIARLQ